MPIFRVKSVKIYTGQKKFTRTPSARPWQVWGMVVSQCFVNTKYLWLKHFADGNGSDRLCVPMQTTISWIYANWVGQWPPNWWFWQKVTNILTNNFFSQSIQIHCQEVAQELNQSNSSNVVWGTCNHLFAEARALRHWDSQVMERIEN